MKKSKVIEALKAQALADKAKAQMALDLLENQIKNFINLRDNVYKKQLPIVRTSFVKMKENEIEGYEPGIITCMEESEYYFDNFKKIIPDEYMEIIKPIYSPRKTAYFENNFGCFYSNIPGNNFDMIFIDGPHTTFPEEPEKAFDADLINLIKDKKIKDPLVILDQRVSTLEILNELIPGLNLKYNPLKMVSIGRIKNLENQD